MCFVLNKTQLIIFRSRFLSTINWVRVKDNKKQNKLNILGDLGNILPSHLIFSTTPLLHICVFLEPGRISSKEINKIAFPIELLLPTCTLILPWLAGHTHSFPVLTLMITIEMFVCVYHLPCDDKRHAMLRKTIRGTVNTSSST